MVGHDVQLRHQLRAAGAGLEGPRSCGQVVVLNVDDPQLLLDGSDDRRVDVFDDLSVVLCDVILKVNHDQCAVFHSVCSPCPVDITMRGMRRTSSKRSSDPKRFTDSRKK